MRSKCSKNKKDTQGDSRVSHWCSYHILTSSMIYYWRYAGQQGLYLFYITKKETTTDKAFYFYFKVVQPNSKGGLNLLTVANTKNPFDVIYYVYKMKQSHWLQCVSKNCDWSRKFTPLSNLTRKSLLVEWKLTGKADLNCEICKSLLKKMLENQISFRHKSSPVSRREANRFQF